MIGFGNAFPESGVRETRWLTPPHIVNALGNFDLDPCGAPGHNLASQTFLLERGENGLSLDWNGRVWCNPPYGREAEPFLKKLADHGNGIAFVFARTETRVFFEQIWGRATALLFLKGRVKFLRSDLSVAGAANAPSVLVAYGVANANALESSGIDGKFIRLENSNG